MKRNKIDEDEAMIRINSQMPIDEKKAKATYIIDNSLNLRNLQAEVETFVDTIKEKYNYKDLYK